MLGARDRHRLTLTSHLLPTKPRKPIADSEQRLTSSVLDTLPGVLTSRVVARDGVHGLRRR
jgi:hypothetical protein